MELYRFPRQDTRKFEEVSQSLAVLHEKIIGEASAGSLRGFEIQGSREEPAEFITKGE